MKITDNTILITGGATGIGFALAEMFANTGNKVIICGRRIVKLNEARDKISQLNIKVCDLSKEKERISLFEWINSKFHNINILINNAGVQRVINFKKVGANLFNNENEIETNLVAPLHLSALFIPLLISQKESAIINVSSGLGFVPLAFMPIYCATKAAIHSFSLSLRHQLKGTSTRVFEIIPPTVDTELDKGEREKREQRDRGIPPTVVAKETIKALENDEYEVAIGMARNLLLGSRNNPEFIFSTINKT
jgi:uncharacterized oxidoreductase